MEPYEPPPPLHPLSPDVAGPLVVAQQVPGDLAAWLIGTPVTVLAFVTWMWLTGRIVTGTQLDRCQAKLDAAEERERQRVLEDRQVLIPLLTRTTDTLTRHLERRLGDTPPPPNKELR